MRIRTVKPEFWTHRMHREICSDSALVALALINYCDDEGRFEADLDLFRAACFPLRPKIDIEKAWGELCTCGWMVLYRESETDKITYGSLPGFLSHQVINRPSLSDHPQLTEASVITQGTLTNNSSGKGRERKGKERKGVSSGQTRHEEMCRKFRQLGVDIERERTKAEAWLLTPKGAGRKFTDAFFAKWLNRSVPDYSRTETAPAQPIRRTYEEAMEMAQGDGQ